MFKLGKLKKILNKRINKIHVLRCGVWFVDIPRTSSSSVRAELGRYYGYPYGKKNVDNQEHVLPQGYRDHKTALSMKALLGSFIWRKIYTFTIVRNPWDRTFSMYSYRRKIGDIPAGWSFRDYVLELSEAPGSSPYFRYHAYYYSAADYVLDDNGDLIVDHIVKYEDRMAGLKIVADKIGINSIGNVHIQSASPENLNYVDVYDEEMKEIIEAKFSRDIDLFGYNFGE